MKGILAVVVFCMMPVSVGAKQLISVEGGCYKLVLAKSRYTLLQRDCD